MTDPTIIKTTEAEFVATLAYIIAKYNPTEEHTVSYDVDIEASVSDKCVVNIDGDEYIIEVAS
jgi:hypothetical protein